jgi:peptide/nickel transport system permease protein
VVRRILFAIIVLFGISIITFILAYMIPGDPARLMAGNFATHEQVAQIRIELGLDRPLYEQYLRYLNRLLHGDLGMSIHTRRPVTEDISEYFAATFELTTISMLIALVIGFPLGIISATKKDQLADHLSRLFSLSGVSMPSFLLGLILQLIFGTYLNILPIGGRVNSSIRRNYPLSRITGLYLPDALLAGNWTFLISAIKHLILPAICLSLASLVLITRMMRANMLEVMREDYITTVKSYGFSNRKVIYKYALRNALIPTITIISLSYGYALAGTFLVETVFSWPGLGRYVTLSIINSDYPAIMGTVLLIAIIVMTLNLLVDISYLYIDPRIKFQ